MKDATAALFKAVRAAILADSTLAGLLGTRVYSTWGNQEANHPLVRMAIPTVRQYEHDGGEGAEHDLSLHVFTAEPAPIVGKQISNRIRDVLTGTLTLEDAHLVSLDYRDTIARTDDTYPSLQMVVLRFLAITTDA